MTRLSGSYAAGLTVRDIRAPLEDVYGLKVSGRSDRAGSPMPCWARSANGRAGALERMYPIVLFDALRVKIRDADSRMVKNKAVYVALGVSRDGVREVWWITENEGANSGSRLMNGVGRTARASSSPSSMGSRAFPKRSRSPSGDHRPDLHRASGAPFIQLLLLEGPQIRGGRPAPGFTRRRRPE